MSSKHLRGDITMPGNPPNCGDGAEGAAGVLYGKDAQKAPDPGAFLADKEKEYQDALPIPTLQPNAVTSTILLNRLKPGQDNQVTGAAPEQARYKSYEEAR